MRWVSMNFYAEVPCITLALIVSNKDTYEILRPLSHAKIVITLKCTHQLNIIILRDIHTAYSSTVTQASCSQDFKTRNFSCPLELLTATPSNYKLRNSPATCRLFLLLTLKKKNILSQMRNFYSYTTLHLYCFSTFIDS